MIKLKSLFHIEQPEDYKLHLASRNEEGCEPLDEYVADPRNWIAWNEWRGNRTDWTRDYIFSLIQFYPRENKWLFGGVFSVVDRHSDRYEVKPVEEFEPYV